MKKNFDAVKIVRQIRDKIAKETRGMTNKELINYYRKGAEKTRIKLRMPTNN